MIEICRLPVGANLIVMFSVIQVAAQQVESLEPLGTKRKYWYTDGERRMLFKAEERGTGEDWAERIACELCRLLGLPHVHYELATEVSGNLPGVVCETLAPPPISLVLGNQLLLAADPNYPVSETQKYKVREHTVDAVTDVVGGLALPREPWCACLPEGIHSSLDLFSGYAMLDAWIANQDRHHQNWGALRYNDVLALSPTFDHGASLARNITDEERAERMSTRDRNRQVSQFARKARSAFYADQTSTKSLPTLKAWHAFATKAPAAALIWRDQLSRIDEGTVSSLLDEVPPNRLSQVGKTFTRELLLANQRAILAGECE